MIFELLGLVLIFRAYQFLFELEIRDKITPRFSEFEIESKA